MRSTWRIACVRIPRFPIAAVWRGRVSAPWDERPVALVDSGRLRAVSAAGSRSSVRTGMTVAEARATCGELHILPWDDTIIERTINEVTAALLAASPQVTPAIGEPGLWWVGAGGLDGLGGEQLLLERLAELARPWHPRPRVAVADSCVAARAATWANRCGRLAFIVPPGGDAAYLADAPLALIPMDEEMRAMLAALGLRIAGALAVLEAEEVERRWGETGLAAWRLARGEDWRRPVLTRLEARRSVEVELPGSTETVEPVLFLVRAALDRLVAELVADGRAAAAVAITLTLDDARGALPSGTPPHTITREIRLAHPLARVPHLFEQCRATLERWAPGAPISGVAVAIVATAPASGEQGDLLSTGWRDPAALDAAFARLRNELGFDVVVRPACRDEHRPERSGAWLDAEERGRWAVRRGSGADGQRGGEAGCALHAAARIHLPAPHTPLVLPAAPPQAAVLRLLETPELVEIERTGGEPSAMWWRGCRLEINRAVGPERLSGDWWKDGYARDYWKCEGTGVRDEGEGGDFLIFFDHAHGGQWYLQGWWD